MKDFVLNHMARRGIDELEAVMLNQKGITSSGIHWQLDFGVKVRLLSEDGTRNRAEYIFSRDYGNVVKKVNDPNFKTTPTEETEIEQIVRKMEGWSRDITKVATDFATCSARRELIDLVREGIKPAGFAVNGLSADEITTTREFMDIVDKAVMYARCMLRAAYDSDDKLFAKWYTDDAETDRGYIAGAIACYLTSLTFQLYDVFKNNPKDKINRFFDCVIKIWNECEDSTKNENCK